MKLTDHTLKSISSSFFIKKFPSFSFFKGITILFAVLAVLGATTFGFYPSEMGVYTNNEYYMLYIKFLPKVLLLFFLVSYNLKKGIQTSALPNNRFLYFISMLFGIAFFIIFFFIIKEFIGTLPQITMDRLPKNADISLLPFYKSATVYKYGGYFVINIPLFFILSLPAILITTYFQLVISNMFTLLIHNTFRRKK